MRLRQATPDDAAVVARFNTLMARETEHHVLDPPLILAGVTAVLTEPAKGVYFLAEIDGAPVGQLLITYEWSDWRNGNFWWLQSVYVQAEFRGRGVFKALFAHVRRLARTRPDVCGLRLYVEQGNARAKEVYQRLGMKPSGYDLLEWDFTRPVGTRNGCSAN